MILATTLAVPVLAGVIGYPAVPYLTSGAYNGFSFPRKLPDGYPFQPFFSYSFNTGSDVALPHVSLQIPATTITRSIYSPPADTYRGFSYQITYGDGGNSHVVFITGPESKNLMEQSVDYFDTLSTTEFKPSNESIIETPLFSSAASKITTTSPPYISSKPETPAASPIPPSTTDATQSLVSLYRAQLYPVHTSSIFGTPITLHSNISSLQHNFEHPIMPAEDIKLKESSIQEHAGEAQESMISEVGVSVVELPITLSSGSQEKPSLTSGEENATKSISAVHIIGSESANTSESSKKSIENLPLELNSLVEETNVIPKVQAPAEVSFSSSSESAARYEEININLESVPTTKDYINIFRATPSTAMIVAETLNSGNTAALADENNATIQTEDLTTISEITTSASVTEAGNPSTDIPATESKNLGSEEITTLPQEETISSSSTKNN